MNQQDIRLGEEYWTYIFLNRPQGTDVQFRVVKVRAVSRVDKTTYVGTSEMTKTVFECVCEAYSEPQAIPAMYWKDGTPEKYMREFKYGDWSENIKFSAEDLYPDVESCIQCVCDRFKQTAANIQCDIDRGDYKTFPGVLVIGGLTKEIEK